eukprot:4475268-Pleurochrysis_carterae.AAC.1
MLMHAHSRARVLCRCARRVPYMNDRARAGWRARVCSRERARTRVRSFIHIYALVHTQTRARLRVSLRPHALESRSATSVPQRPGLLKAHLAHVPLARCRSSNL